MDHSISKRAQPKWQLPQPSSTVMLPELYLYNSLTSKKEKFIPEKGVTVRWYTCGPTVYDISHMGHARTYLAFDILRRIFRDYFLFNVVYVLNITDIDDKIIKKARQTHLMENYVKSDHDLASLYTDISKAIRILNEKSINDPDPDKRDYLKREAERLTSLLSTPSHSGDDVFDHLIQSARDALADMLDREFGASVTDHKIFDSTARHFEEEYHKDMRALNILEPDALVRVTESITPIIQFVEKIIANGFAYVVPSGSVYFDTNRFANDPKHFYAKLVPTAYGDSAQLATGEGELSLMGEKRSPNDFALWKASKTGEPSWPSPWGRGRPGWHIECSVMASGIFGDSMEIHGGGVDLKFPHHDNELAQSEAHFGHSHWVRYFMHAGHLTISGCKMSKSLKNFISIRDALKQNSARRLRFIFLLHSWRDTMDYSEDTVAEAVAFEKLLIDFFYNASNLQLRASDVGSQDSISTNEADRTLLDRLSKLQHDVYNAFCDSCDTRQAMAAIKEFVAYADQVALTSADDTRSICHQATQVYLSASYILRLFRVLGAADLTIASAGTPVPAGAVVAGGPLHPDTQPIQLHLTLPEDPRTFLSRSWLSFDAPTVGVMASTFHTCLKAAQTLGQLLLDKGDALAAITQSMAEYTRSTFGLDLFNLPPEAEACLDGSVSKLLDRSLLELSSEKFGMELHVWPIVCNLILRVASMRQSLRHMLLTDKAIDKALKQQLLSACDHMRDQDFGAAGIRLQDRTTVSAISQGMNLVPFVGIVDPVILAEELAARTKRQPEKKASNQHQQAKTENGVISPAEMFLNQREKFSAFDAKGMPTHDTEGKPLSKTQLKKLQKLYDAQAKRYEAFSRQKS